MVSFHGSLPLEEKKGLYSSLYLQHLDYVFLNKYTLYKSQGMKVESLPPFSEFVLSYKGVTCFKPINPLVFEIRSKVTCIKFNISTKLAFSFHYELFLVALFNETGCTNRNGVSDVYLRMNLSYFPNRSFSCSYSSQHLTQ